MKRITYDVALEDALVAAPRVGDILECRSRRTGEPTGTTYRVVASRQVRSRVAPGERYALLVTDERTSHGAERVLPLYWHPRMRKN